jgi:hypothetical protein
MQLPFEQAIGLIKEADILLFRNPPWPKLGWWIARFTSSEYSHVGMAHLENDIWYVVEYREFQKSRMYPLQRYLESGADIDVFRVMSPINFSFLHISGNGSPKYNIEEIQLTFSDQVANNIIKEAKKLLGRKYGWWNIWRIMGQFIPFVRLLSAGKRENVIQEMVCSTLVTWCYRRFYIDLCPNTVDSLTTPADISRSGLLSYLFSLTI